MVDRRQNGPPVTNAADAARPSPPSHRSPETGVARTALAPGQTRRTEKEVGQVKAVSHEQAHIPLGLSLRRFMKMFLVSGRNMPLCIPVSDRAAM
jgi:hypothetical protein